MAGDKATIELDADENAILRRAIGQSYQYLTRLARENPTLAPAVDEALQNDIAAVLAIWGRIAAMPNGEGLSDAPPPDGDTSPSPFYSVG